MSPWAPALVIAVFGVTPLILTFRIRRGQAHWVAWKSVLAAVASLNTAMAVFCGYQAVTTPAEERLWVEPISDTFDGAGTGTDWWITVFMLTPVVSVVVRVAAPLATTAAIRTVSALGREQGAAYAAGAQLPVVEPIGEGRGTFLLPTEPIIALCRHGIAVVAVDPGQEVDDEPGEEGAMLYPPVLVAYVSARATKTTVAAVSKAWGAATAIAPDDRAAITALQRAGVDAESVPYPPALENIDIPAGIVVTDALRQSVAAATTIIAVAAGIAGTTQAHDAWYRMAAAFEGAL